MESINLPPFAPVLMESTRAIGYSLESAVADIIDNSISAKASTIEIHFFPLDESFIAIIDNGTGMDEDELTLAMRYGSRSPNEERSSWDLGRFGLGLKTASLSQCRKLTVISLKNGKLSGRQWDLDYVLSTGEWSLIILGEKEINSIILVQKLQKFGSGTMVLWQELDRLKAGEFNFEEKLGLKMDSVRGHIALVFHRFLMGEPGLKKIEIFINNLPINPIDPFIIDKSTQVMDDEYIKIHGHRITVRPYVLPHISKMTEEEIKKLGGKDGLRKLQGFYVYRNKRLLIWGTWFKMMRQGDLSKLARIRVDIPNSLDHLWTLDIKKSTAIPPELVKRNLSAIIEKIAEKSKRIWTFRGKKETDNAKIHLWDRKKTRDDGVFYEINRDYPLIKQIKKELNITTRNELEQLFIQIERNLPLNSLYVDLTNDEAFYNDNDLSKNDLYPLFKQLLNGCRSIEERKGILEKMTLLEPFDKHPEWLDEFLEKVGLNAKG